MDYSSRLRLLVAWFILVFVTGASLVAQEVPKKPDPESASTIPQGKPALPTISELTDQRQVASQDADLSEDVRGQIDAHFAKAIENLQAANQSDELIAKLREELDGSPQRVMALEKILENRKTEPKFSEINFDDVTELDQLTKRWQDAEERVNDLEDELQKLTLERDRRNTRRPQLSELRTQLEQQLEETTAKVAAPPPEEERPELTTIRQTRLQTRLHRLRREIAQIEQETRTYEATSRRWTLEQDLKTLELQEAEHIAQVWQQRLADVRMEQAEREEKEATRALTLSHSSIRDVAKRNSTLAKENSLLTDTLQTTQAELDQVHSQLDAREEEFRALQERAEAAEYSQAVGVLLRSRRVTLPDQDVMRARIQNRRNEINSLNLQLMEWQAERKTLVDLDAATMRILNTLEDPPRSVKLEDLQEQVRELLTSRLKILSNLTANGSSKLDLLVRLDSTEKRLLSKVEHEAQWLAEHVLWVRSTGVLGTHLSMFADATRILASPMQWQRFREILLNDLSRNSWVWVLCFITAAGLFVLRSKLKSLVKKIGELAERPNCVTILPTLKTLVYTLLIALPIPLLVYSFGWRMVFLSQGENTLRTIGETSQLIAYIWFVLAMSRQVAQNHGLGDAHFEWSDKSLSTIRQTMRMLEMTLIPALFVLIFTEKFGDDDIAATFGRVAFIASMIFVELALYRLVRPSSPILQNLGQEFPESLLWRARWVWTTFLLFVPVALAIMSATGFHYTSIQLTRRVATTTGYTLIIVLVISFLFRWLLVTYRKLAIRRAQERRRQILQAAQNENDQPIPPDATPELRLTDINVQVRSLLRLTGGASLLVAMYMIWSDVLPALGVLGRISMGWDNGIAGLSSDGLPIPVTVADFLTSVTIIALTLFASSNLPGLLEISILQRLPMDAGARYAASTVSRYLIVVTGVVLSFRGIGIGWSSVQWLLAAMSVGLGFGLQEIFANFVSGIILLFERPIRVGDTVTIGEITGTVTRIQIRATTVLDWDNKELIVPNREFVTGNLVNWTLSSPTLRVILKVGIAYGSDTRLATKLLYEIAEKNPHVLDEPEPVVVFSEFGDSTLNLELRLYVNGLFTYRRLKHELNTAIDDLFKEHSIEIAFPQRDLHVRSLPAEMLNLEQNDSDLPNLSEIPSKN
ncbi:mechanosensitive ion channel domain-containing protein [Thalassoglobus sp.]|uniref:mechanosensitive ion channel domain-containing protein n=1 Tax=Thalassoglobus sp. TaxID=2795869 RepID=UPI003AA81244